MADQLPHVHHSSHVHYSHVGSGSRLPPSPRAPPPPLELILQHPHPCAHGDSGNATTEAAPMGSPDTGRRAAGYRGIRQRSGKWVSEIREPGKSSRIWLGTYPIAEMAAVAYDVAAHALRGADAVLNFPDEIAERPTPASASPTAIRAAAAEAAAEVIQRRPSADQTDGEGPEGRGLKVVWAEEVGKYVDEDEIFDMPQLLVNMAEGMLMSPPRLSPSGADDVPEVYEGESLWSYP